MAFDPFADDDDGVLSAGEVEAIRCGESSMPDVEAAEALVDSVSGLMVSVATDGPPIKTVDADYKREHRALRAVLRRLGINYPNKFDDLWRWHGRWTDTSMPRYRDRREFIANLFAPVPGSACGPGRPVRTSWPKASQRGLRVAGDRPTVGAAPTVVA